jgi:hypothetical protein
MDRESEGFHHLLLELQEILVEIAGAIGGVVRR